MIAMFVTSSRALAAHAKKMMFYVRARAREKVKICETCKNILGDTKKFREMKRRPISLFFGKKFGRYSC